MRHLLLACAALAACSQPAEPEPEASPGVIVLDAAMLPGVWSFDRSCASGDAMALYPDNTATFDEWGDGTWALGDDGELALDLAVVEPGILEPPPDAPRVSIVITPTELMTEDHLRGRRQMSGAMAGDVEIDALKCPTAPPSP